MKLKLIFVLVFILLLFLLVNNKYELVNLSGDMTEEENSTDFLNEGNNAETTNTNENENPTVINRPNNNAGLVDTNEDINEVEEKFIKVILDDHAELYELINISGIITAGERTFELLDEPENNAELVVANFLLSVITGDFERWLYLYPNIQVVINNSIKSYNDGLGAKSIIINHLTTLTDEEIINEKHYNKDFKDARIFSSGITYLDVVKQYEIENYKIIKAEYVIEYTEKSMELAPQYPPGLYTVYHILGSNSNNDYIIYEESMR